MCINVVFRNVILLLTIDLCFVFFMYLFFVNFVNSICLEMKFIISREIDVSVEILFFVQFCRFVLDFFVFVNEKDSPVIGLANFANHVNR